MSEMNFDEIEFETNNDPRVPISVVIDASDSMTQVFPGETRTPLEVLNGSLDILISEIHKDPLSRRRVEISFVIFGTQIADPTPFSTIDNIVLPELSPMGITNTGAALTKALDALEERKESYKKNSINYYQPQLLILTDGMSMDSLDEVSKRIKDLESKKKLSFFAVGVEGADLEQLSSIGNRPALGLKGMEFGKLFEWVSQSAISVSSSAIDQEKIPLPSPAEWASL